MIFRNEVQAVIGKNQSVGQNPIAAHIIPDLFLHAATEKVIGEIQANGRDVVDGQERRGGLDSLDAVLGQSLCSGRAAE